MQIDAVSPYATQNFNVMSHAQVSRLLVSADRVTGVEVQRNGRIEQIQADGEVILSSGAIGSPAIVRPARSERRIPSLRGELLQALSPGGALSPDHRHGDVLNRLPLRARLAFALIARAYFQIQPSQL